MNSQSNIIFTPLLDEMLQQGKSVQISLGGLSMFPFLMHGDIVQISPIEIKKLKCGDIVVFKEDNNWIAHRLIKKNIHNNLFHTRGDGAKNMDKPIKQEQIKGIVVKIVKSRWKFAYCSIGKHTKFLAFFSPFVAPVFNAIMSLLIFLRK